MATKKTGKPNTPPTPSPKPDNPAYRTTPPQPRQFLTPPPPPPARPALTSAHLDAMRYDQYALSVKDSKEAKIYKDKADAIRAKLYPRGPSQVDRAVNQLNAKVARQQPNANMSGGGTRSVLEGMRSFMSGGLRKGAK